MKFDEFYHRDYLKKHENRVCKTLHVLGVPLALAPVGAAVWFQRWWLLALIPAPAYLLAWLGHAYAHNNPTFFGHPWWSLRAYWKMIGGVLSGKA